MTAAVFHSAQEYQGAVGRTFGPTDWLVVDQQRINLFADATGDHQWIHVDPVRAAAGPFGTTIAHGYYTLSLLPVLVGSMLHVDGVKMGINYGTNKVRFTAPVPVDSEIRAGVTLAEVKEIAGG